MELNDGTGRGTEDVRQVARWQQRDSDGKLKQKKAISRNRTSHIALLQFFAYLWLPISDCPVWAAHSDCPPRIGAPQTGHFKLPTTDCFPWAAHLRLPNSDCQSSLCISDCPPTPTTSDCPLLIAHLGLPISGSLPTSE